MPRELKIESEKSFDRLGDLVRKAGVRLRSRCETPRLNLQTAESQGPVLIPASSGSTEEELFRTAMRDVDPACWRQHRPASDKPSPPAAKDPDLEARRLMEATLKGDSPAAVSEHPEYIEGWIGIAGKKFLPKLRNGFYSVQGQIDLHGLSRAEAQFAVEDFIVRMSRFRSCCIKIIHGRGINSRSERATIKESLQRFLKTRRMSRYVVAYASASSRDGGVGAVYVLLSRR